MNLSHAPGAELAFATRVADLAAEPPGEERTSRLLELLREDAVEYRQRSSAATSRMRGWVLLALARPSLPEAATLHVMEELDNGRAPYLVAAAARAMRGAPAPSPAMAPFVVQALSRIRDNDEYLDLDNYGGASGLESGATAFAELLATLRWLGASAAGVVPELEALRRSTDRPLADEEIDDVERTVQAIRAACPPASQDGAAAAASADFACCAGIDLWGAFRRWRPGTGGDTGAIEFEDQDGGRVRYGEFFSGRPAIVVFFYTRCDNAQKCSLTVSKMARVQQHLREAGMDGRIRTAAITYDATYDLPGRLRGYAQSRGVAMNADHRVLRAVAGAAQLHAHFRLGVNFVESLVNRHRIEAYLVDAQGRIAASFERIRWDERRVVDEAMQMLASDAPPGPARIPGTFDADAGTADAAVPPPGAATPVRGTAHRSGTVARRDCEPTASTPGRSTARHTTAPMLTLAIALFPKCPLCGATYLSISGMAAMPTLPPVYWLFPVLLLLTAANLASLGLLARARRRWEGFALALAGAALVLAFGVASGHAWAMWIGVGVSVAGSLAGVMLPARDGNGAATSIRERARKAPRAATSPPS